MAIPAEYLRPLSKTIKPEEQQKYIYAIEKYLEKYGNLNPSFIKKNLTWQSLVFALTIEEINTIFDKYGKDAIYILIIIKSKDLFQTFEKYNCMDFVKDKIAYNIFSKEPITEEKIEIYRRYKPLFKEMEKEMNIQYHHKILEKMLAIPKDWLDDILLNPTQEKIHFLVRLLKRPGGGAEMKIVCNILRPFSLDELYKMNLVHINATSFKGADANKTYTKDEAKNVLNNLAKLHNFMDTIDFTVYEDIITSDNFYNAILIKSLINDKGIPQSLINLARMAIDADPEDIEYLEKVATIYLVHYLPRSQLVLRMLIS